jgi:hypothetical protein
MATSESHAEPAKSSLFANLTVYINGSTYPFISDHELKRLLVDHGATVSLALAARYVTHVVIGRPAAGSSTSGAGGGLAAGKIHREVQRVRGRPVKYVSVQWLVRSIISFFLSCPVF